MKETKGSGEAGGKKAAAAKKAVVGKKVPLAAKKAGVVVGTGEGNTRKGGIYQRDDIKKKPTVSSKPIPTTKIIEGLGSAREEVSRLVEQIVETFGGNTNVSEISLTLGFNAKGAFLGIGVGGAASVSVKIKMKEERQGR